MAKSDGSVLTAVGEYKEEFNEILDICLPCDTVYQSDGLIKHIAKKHTNCLKYMDQIGDIINQPDYIGNNPKKPNSIELIKCLDDNIMVAIELDKEENYLYISSMYEWKQSKLERRIYSGRVKALNCI